jgi:hypothetical protein
MADAIGAAALALRTHPSSTFGRRIMRISVGILKSIFGQVLTILALTPVREIAHRRKETVAQLVATTDANSSTALNYEHVLI